MKNCLSIDESSKVLRIKVKLLEPVRAALVTFLKANSNVFAWQHSDIVEIDLNIMCHHLNIDTTKKPMRQKRRVMDLECYVALKEEGEKLLEIGFIRESFYLN